MCGKKLNYQNIVNSTGVFGCTCSSQHKCGTVFFARQSIINLTKC